jgi:hypothetical protein
MAREKATAIAASRSDFTGPFTFYFWCQSDSTLPGDGAARQILREVLRMTPMPGSA